MGVVWFRLALALFLAYMFWPADLVPRDHLLAWPRIAQLYHNVFLTTAYRFVIYGCIILFAVGWRPRFVGIVLFLVLLPHGFLSEGLQSRQVLLFTVLCISLVPTLPVWHWHRLRTNSWPMGPMWPVRLIQLQLTALYGINAVFKSTPKFLSGDVLQALSTQPNFLVDLTDGYLLLGAVSIPVAILAVATVVTEYWLALGFWIPRFRLLTATIGIAFHFTLKFVMSIFMLDYVSMFLYLAFLLPFLSPKEEGER